MHAAEHERIALADYGVPADCLVALLRRGRTTMAFAVACNSVPFWYAESSGCIFFELPCPRLTLSRVEVKLSAEMRVRQA